MTSRIIITGKNREFKRLVTCPECEGRGYVKAYEINPSAPGFNVPCTMCNGEGAFYKGAA